MRASAQPPRRLQAWRCVCCCFSVSTLREFRPPAPRPPAALSRPLSTTHRPRHATPAHPRPLPPRAVPLDAASLPDAHTTVAALSDLADAALAATSGRQDGGWLAPVADSLESSLLFFRNAFDAAGVPYSYGWAIIALTAATKVATFPFTRKQVESSLAVAKLKPDIDDIKRQYADDKDAVQRETSALYEKAGVDPAAGCAPTLATLPVFWGLYRALSNVAADGSLADGFYWIPSLSGPTSVTAQRAGTGTAWLLPLVDGAPPGGWDGAAPYLVLPVLLVLAQYASSAVMTPPKPGDGAGGAGAAAGTALTLGLPLMVGWFSLNVPAGLSLYYFANTIMTSSIQIWLRKLGGASAFEWQNEIGVSRARRDGEPGDVPAPWLLDLDVGPVLKAASAPPGAAVVAAAGGETETNADDSGAAALASLPRVTRSKRRRAGGLPEGAASLLAEAEEKEREKEKVTA